MNNKFAMALTLAILSATTHTKQHIPYYMKNPDSTKIDAIINQAGCGCGDGDCNSGSNTNPLNEKQTFINIKEITAQQLAKTVTAVITKK